MEAKGTDKINKVFFSTKCVFRIKKQEQKIKKRIDRSFNLKFLQWLHATSH